MGSNRNLWRRIALCLLWAMTVGVPEALNADKVSTLLLSVTIIHILSSQCTEVGLFHAEQPIPLGYCKTLPVFTSRSLALNPLELRCQSSNAGALLWSFQLSGWSKPPPADSPRTFTQHSSANSQPHSLWSNRPQGACLQCKHLGILYHDNSVS